MTDRPSNVIPFRPAADGAPQSWYSMRAATDTAPARVDLYDEIGAWGITAKQFADDLRALDGEGLEVEIHINSPGGEVFDGVAIATAIAGMKARTIGFVDGVAASMASIVFVACDERRMPENAFVMVHNPSTIAFGEAKDLRKAAETLDTLRGQMVRTYAKATGQSEDEIGELLDATTWLTALDATALGFNHTVLDAVKAAACIRADAAERMGEIPDEAKAFLIEEEEAEAGDDETAGEVDAADATDATDGDEVTDADSTAVEGETTDATDPSADDNTTATDTTDEPADEALSEQEQNQIIGACAAFDMADRAEGFIEARASITDVRKALWAARAQADEAIETDPTAPAVEEDAGTAPAKRSGIAAARAKARNGGRTKKPL